MFLFSERDRDVEDIEDVSSLSSEVSSTTGLEENWMRASGEKDEITLDWDFGRAEAVSMRVVQSWDCDLEAFNLLCAPVSGSRGFWVSEKTSRSELTPQLRFRSRVMGEAGLVDVSPSEDRLEFDCSDLKWRMSTREEQEVTDPDLSSEVVVCLGDDLVVTAYKNRIINITLNCLPAVLPRMAEVGFLWWPGWGFPSARRDWYVRQTELRQSQFWVLGRWN